ncbi:hypothetical protein [Fibrella forsythiae]|uniref:Uncharacterized protein n=1 Tax=Fibrella forsythiae TaxID=2817061 RepID=A0ABS3JCT4_9BACT|nr:hypothetical protein [Fibrella forsythiae]MBO0947815.1 hypothetical protein [Fibrella forsythiae]
MEPEKDNWINDVMGSLDGLNRTEPSPFLFARIRNRLSTTPSTAYVPGRLVWVVAASFAVLALLNWQILAGMAGQGVQEKNELNTVITEMHLYPASNQLYDLWSGQNY